MHNERRKFKRYPLEFKLDIQGNNQAGNSFRETAQLIDISGGGALFCSLLVDSYYEGQLLQTVVLLPGTPKVKGKMNTQATVTRLQQDPDQQLRVSVQFVQPLKLTRSEP